MVESGIYIPCHASSRHTTTILHPPSSHQPSYHTEYHPLVSAMSMYNVYIHGHVYKHPVCQSASTYMYVHLHTFCVCLCHPPGSPKLTGGWPHIFPSPRIASCNHSCCTRAPPPPSLTSCPSWHRPKRPGTNIVFCCSPFSHIIVIICCYNNLSLYAERRDCRLQATLHGRTTMEATLNQHVHV